MAANVSAPSASTNGNKPQTAAPSGVESAAGLASPPTPTPAASQERISTPVTGDGRQKLTVASATEQFSQQRQEMRQSEVRTNAEIGRLIELSGYTEYQLARLIIEYNDGTVQMEQAGEQISNRDKIIQKLAPVLKKRLEEIEGKADNKEQLDKLKKEHERIETWNKRKKPEEKKHTVNEKYYQVYQGIFHDTNEIIVSLSAAEDYLISAASGVARIIVEQGNRSPTTNLPGNIETRQESTTPTRLRQYDAEEWAGLKDFIYSILSYYDPSLDRNQIILQTAQMLAAWESDRYQITIKGMDENELINKLKEFQAVRYKLYESFGLNLNQADQLALLRLDPQAYGDQNTLVFHNEVYRTLQEILKKEYNTTNLLNLSDTDRIKVLLQAREQAASNKLKKVAESILAEEEVTEAGEDTNLRDLKAKAAEKSEKKKDDDAILAKAKEVERLNTEYTQMQQIITAIDTLQDNRPNNQGSLDALRKRKEKTQQYLDNIHNQLIHLKLDQDDVQEYYQTQTKLEAIQEHHTHLRTELPKLEPIIQSRNATKQDIQNREVHARELINQQQSRALTPQEQQEVDTYQNLLRDLQRQDTEIESSQSFLPFIQTRNHLNSQIQATEARIQELNIIATRSTTEQEGLDNLQNTVLPQLRNEQQVITDEIDSLKDIQNIQTRINRLQTQANSLNRELTNIEERNSIIKGIEQQIRIVTTRIEMAKNARKEPSDEDVKNQKILEDQLSKTTNEIRQVTTNYTEAQNAFSSANEVFELSNDFNEQYKTTYGNTPKDRSVKLKETQIELAKERAKLTELETGEPSETNKQYGEATAKLYSILTEDFNSIIDLVFSGKITLTELSGFNEKLNNYDAQAGYDALLKILTHTGGKTLPRELEERMFSRFSIAYEIADFYGVEFTGELRTAFDQINAKRTEYRLGVKRGHIMEKQQREYRQLEDQYTQQLLEAVLPQIHIHGSWQATELIQHILRSKLKDALDDTLLDPPRYSSEWSRPVEPAPAPLPQTPEGVRVPRGTELGEQTNLQRRDALRNIGIIPGFNSARYEQGIDITLPNGPTNHYEFVSTGTGVKLLVEGVDANGLRNYRDLGDFGLRYDAATDRVFIDRGFAVPSETNQVRNLLLQEMFMSRLTRLANPAGPPIPWSLADGNIYDLSLENGVLMINIGGTISPLIEIVQQYPNLLAEDYLANNITGRDLIGMPYSLEQQARRLVNLRNFGTPLSMREYSGNITEIEIEQGTKAKIINWEGLKAGIRESVIMKIQPDSSIEIVAQDPMPANEKFTINLTGPNITVDNLINIDLTNPTYNLTPDMQLRAGIYIDQLLKSIFDYYISLPANRKQELANLPVETVTSYQDKQYNAISGTLLNIDKEIYRSQNGELIIRDANTQQEQLLTEFIAQKNRDNVQLGPHGPWINTQIEEIKHALGTQLLKALHQQTKNP